MITTYDSNCMKCMSGAIHPFHDNGEPAEVMVDDGRFSQLPPEREPMRYVTGGSAGTCSCGCHERQTSAR